MGFIHHEGYGEISFTPPPIQITERYKKTYDILKELGVFNDKARVYVPTHAREEDLLLVHTKEYIDFVRKMSKIGTGFLDYGDTPAYKGIFELSCLRTGASLLAIDLVMNEEVNHAFNPGGGFHHADKDSAGGFCVFNDVVIGVKYIERKYDVRKIAIVDIDGHHADGTQKILYEEPVLKISLHKYEPFFYPGTGGIEEIGIGKGRGYSVNIPLPSNTYDEAYLYAFKEIVPPLIKAYDPEILIHQFGVDGHYLDPLVGLSLTTRAYQEVSEIVHKLAHETADGRYVILGGGGYNPDNVARCWSIMFVRISEALPEESIEKFELLHDKVELNKDKRLFDEVKERVKLIKEKVFPIHGLDY